MQSSILKDIIFVLVYEIEFVYRIYDLNVHIFTRIFKMNIKITRSKDNVSFKKRDERNESLPNSNFVLE
jgi:hypothetical protein